MLLGLFALLLLIISLQSVFLVLEVLWAKETFFSSLTYLVPFIIPVPDRHMLFSVKEILFYDFIIPMTLTWVSSSSVLIILRLWSFQSVLDFLDV